MRESTYLNQVVADLNQTKRRLAVADSQHAADERAQQELVYAYQRTEPVSLDSLTAWLWGTFLRPPNPVPITATIDALISTGDLRLIRDDSLRTAMVAYASLMHASSQALERTTDESAFGAKQEIGSHVDMAEVAAIYYSVGPGATSPSPVTAIVLPGVRRTRFPLDRERLLNDRALYGAIVDLSRLKANLKAIRQGMGAATDTLAARIAARRDQ